jgi:F0F1-type ATP synthase assembly protein I
MIFASHTSTNFDSHPKFYRMFSCIILNLSIFIEIITPLYPSYFLILASLGNVGKNISWLSTSASKSIIHRNLSNSENLADITVKSGSQTIGASIIGTIFGIFLSYFIGTDTLFMLLTFTLLGSIHLYSTYTSLNYVTISTLNEQRCNLVMKYFIQYG